MLSSQQRARFDARLDDVVARLPDHLHAMMEEVPLIVEDEPDEALLAELGIERGRGDLCGLHSGVPLTQRSVWSSGTMPDRMMMFRGPVMRLARFKHKTEGEGGEEQLERQIRITLLHEIGHHFGLDEDDLTALGYG